MKRPLSVLKFGSSVLRGDRDLASAVHEIYRRLRAGRRVVAVVSAMGDSTDRLLERARAAGGGGESAHAAALLATGEDACVALLALALERAGVPAARFDARRAGLVTRGPSQDAEPVELDTAAFERALDACPVAVAPGFVGRSRAGEVSLLGRGGSDLSALFIAHRLGARECVLVKDVDGLYERDPAEAGPRPRRFARVAYADALRLGGGIVQAKAIRFAEEVGLELHVGDLGGSDASCVGRGPTAFAPRSMPAPPLAVTLLGLGTVGGGVARALVELPEEFDVRAVLVRHPERHAGSIPRALMTTDPERALGANSDVVVELIGGTGLAARLVRRALREGRDVVTANKASLARHGVEWAGLAAARGSRLRFSAAVGGALPALELVRALRGRGERVVALEGVLSGTANFVLDAMAAGSTRRDAVDRARALGLAERDPRRDLDGTDSAEKLALLARAAFDAEPEWMEREGIDRIGAAFVSGARERGEAVRLVASCALTGAGPIASVRPLVLEGDHALAAVTGERNALVVRLASGRTETIRGTGAGRWPTTESVLGDLFDLRRERASVRTLTAAS